MNYVICRKIFGNGGCTLETLWGLMFYFMFVHVKTSKWEDAQLMYLPCLIFARYVLQSDIFYYLTYAATVSKLIAKDGCYTTNKLDDKWL